MEVGVPTHMALEDPPKAGMVLGPSGGLSMGSVSEADLWNHRLNRSLHMALHHVFQRSGDNPG